MGCLNSIFKLGPDENVVQGEKNIGGRGHEGSFQKKQHPTGFMTALTTLSSALSLEFKTIPRSLVVKTFDIAWALGGL